MALNALAPARDGSAPPRLQPPEVQLQQLVEEHFQYVWRLLRRLGVEAATADDEAQRVFLVANAKLHHVVPKKEKAFLTSIALRIASNARRATQRKQQRETEFALREAAEAATPDELVERKRMREILDEILGQLSDQQRVVFVLSELEGMTRREVATVLDIPTGTVASRLRLAQQRFAVLAEQWRQHLEPVES